MRAWGEDAKREAATDGGDTERCVRCGGEYDTGCRSEDWDGVACPDCARQLSDGAPIEVI
jgi:hypothetical protein